MIPKSQTINVALQEGYESRYLFQAEKIVPLREINPKVEEVVKSEGLPSKIEPLVENENAPRGEKGTMVGGALKVEGAVHVNGALKSESAIYDEKPPKMCKVDRIAA